MSASPGFPYFQTALGSPGRPSAVVAEVFRTAAVLSLAYERRRCFVCGHYGFCTDRERDVELAIAHSSYGIGGRIA